MSALREATTGATTASAFFSSAIGTPNLPIRGGAAANTINRCNSAGGKTWHAARKSHGRSGPSVAASSQIGFRFFGNFLGYKISFVRAAIAHPQSRMLAFCWPLSVGREPKNPPFGHHSYRAYQRQLNRRRRQSLAAALQLSVKKLDCGNALFAGDGY